MPPETLLDLARSASEDALPRVLEVVADTILHLSGFRTVVLNVFRPAWDDFEAVLVKGEQESTELLLGSRAPREIIMRLVGGAREPFPGIYLLTDPSPVWDELDVVYTPDRVSATDEGHWRADDALLVMLSDAGGQPVGLVSMDEPASGLRPADRELRLVAVICSYAEQALRSARRSERAEAEKLTLARLTLNSPRLTASTTLDELYTLAAETTVELGFGNAEVFVRDASELRLRARCGPRSSSNGEPHLAIDRVRLLFEAHRAQSGCWLVAADRVPACPEDSSLGSRCAGHGPLAWGDRRLLVPWNDTAQQLAGVLLIDDPIDHLLPSEEHLGVMRLLVDLVASLETSTRQRLQLARQASHDALTGLRNRRDLDQLIGDSPEPALLLCDLDHFKQINDTHGHETGDRVLRRFGELLRGVARDQDVAIRLGGEEFCLVLPHTDRAGAVAAAERVRSAAHRQLAEIIPGGVTVSVGVAVRGARPLGASALLAQADRGLYHAKRTGRDRVAVAPS